MAKDGNTLDQHSEGSPVMGLVGASTPAVTRYFQVDSAGRLVLSPTAPLGTVNQGTPLASGAGWRFTEYGTSGLPNAYLNTGSNEVPAILIVGPTGAAAGVGGASNDQLKVIDSGLVASTFVNQAVGKLAGTSLTGSYQTLLTTAFAARTVFLFNSCNQTIRVSMDNGTTDTFELEPRESFTWDTEIKTVFSGGTAIIKVKHNGVAPTSGTVRATVLG